MYHCHLHVYLLGRQCEIFESIKEMPPLENFTHEYMESEGVEESLAVKGDVIFASLKGMDPGDTVKTLLSAKKRDAELILLADKSQVSAFSEYMADIKDIWICPMSEEEARFRFLRWQEGYKMGRDFWQTSHYFETTINSVPNLIWYKDKNGIHEKVNDSFCKAVNKTKEQVQGQGHAYIWDVEQDDPACIESEREVMEKRETCISEETIQTGAGIRTLTTYKSPLYDVDGSVMGTAGVGIDITKERAFEQDLLQKNQTLEKIFTTLDCGVMLHTADGANVISANLAALKILGYETIEEMMADGFDMVAETVLEEDKGKLRECIRTLTTVGESVSVDYRVKHKDGEVLHIMGNIKLLQENGQLLYRRFLLDCTEQKLLEEKNEKRQMELIHALSIDYNIICAFDLETDIGTALRGNKGAGGIFICPEGESLSYTDCMERYIERFVHEEDRNLLKEHFSAEGLKKELAEKNLYSLNYRVCTGEGIEYFEIKAVPTGKWSETKGIVLGFRSVDKEIRSEMEKKTLLENALQQANRANEAKSIFLSNMSHDIRTPMNAIVGFTSLALTRIDNKEQVEGYLKKIMTSGNHLLNLINDVLDMSRIESGKIHLDEAPCSLPDILHGLRSILQADIHAKHLDFTIDEADIVDEEIYCDELRLNQVLLNLLSNAVKYTGTGGKICMKVTQKPAEQEDCGTYEFYIKDNGIGMSEEFVQRIFEPFEREKCSTTSGIQGTGLGMAITKNIVEMMHGVIDIKSRKEEGTEVNVCFTFRLHPREEEKKLRKNKNRSTKHYTGHILLAEDNELNQEIALAILEDAGFTADVAGNGKIAVEMLKNSEPGYYQLVLMDVRMPVMDGYEATREIRRLENKELADIPILAMTANAFEEDRREALQCGMNGHLAKPIDIKGLFEMLDTILSEES